MKRLGYSIMLSAIVTILASCNKTPMETTTRFSILGDSYSTFEGYVTPDSNDVWYQLPPNNHIDVTSVEQMWWYQVMQAKGWELERNNSFSGSLICNQDVANYYGSYSFLRRMDKLGSPDVIFVFGGTNDVWNEVPWGEYQYSGWTEEELCTFRPALAKMCDGLRSLYPNAKVYFLFDTELGSEAEESVHTVLDHYGIQCIELYDICKSWNHPNAEGMTTIARQVIDAIE